MNSNRIRTLALVSALAMIAATGTGCSKKATEAPPTPAQPPAQADTAPPVPPTPAPTPTPPAPTAPTTTQLIGQLQPVFFDYDSFALSDDSRLVLDADARLLRDNPTLNVTIEGHCDERGTVEYNQALGERRAQAARDYLAAAGIAASRMRVISYGKERPFAAGADESAFAQNRRAHFGAP